MHKSLLGRQHLHLGMGIGMVTLTSFSIVASVAATMATGLAAPDGHEGTGVAVGTAPSQDITIGGLDDSKDMTGALVGHF